MSNDEQRGHYYGRYYGTPSWPSQASSVVQPNSTDDQGNQQWAPHQSPYYIQSHAGSVAPETVFPPVVHPYPNERPPATPIMHQAPDGPNHDIYPVGLSSHGYGRVPQNAQSYQAQDIHDRDNENNTFGTSHTQDPYYATEQSQDSGPVQNEDGTLEDANEMSDDEDEMDDDVNGDMPSNDQTLSEDPSSRAMKPWTIICDRCGTVLTGQHARGNLTRHYKSRGCSASAKNNGAYQCPHCKSNFARSDGLSVHLRRKHNGSRSTS
ncbi:hypothetical protein BDV96DRAFT_375350 [Lophiotrema nucula]|uniref:C2H2-type domain-containing protein n=1 Tax=Lophiotrema nucula TaxID=690887 RepID=A0A6A5YE39_9PLEO|nr:hypothetical protein BDV96DRAFT_375350 [Lophiotrema nucula]